MNNANLTIYISIAGILGTLISSFIGHYFTAKGRIGNFRQLLYGKQLDLLVRLIQKQSRIKNFLIILLDEKSPYWENAEADLLESIADYSILREEGATLLPVELFGQFSNSLSLLHEFAELVQTRNERMKEVFISLTAIDLKAALMTRAFIGTDELSEKNLHLLGTRTSLKRLDKSSGNELEELVRKGAENI